MSPSCDISAISPSSWDRPERWDRAAPEGAGSFQSSGGSVTGTDISGRILNLGADWQTIFADGTAELDTRYAMETDDGALIEVVNYGFRHGPADVIERLAAGEDVPPESYYMRTQARLETGDAGYGWVNRMLFVGTGARQRSSVRISLFAVE